jgi:polar amino acid transport system substrate-binding protein
MPFAAIISNHISCSIDALGIFVMNLRHLALYSVMTLCLFSASTAYALNDLRIAMLDNSPPFNMKNDAGEWVGFDVDMAHALCQQMQVSCILVPQDHPELLAGLRTHNYDAVLASLAIADSSKNQDIVFSQHYYSSALRFVAANHFNAKPMQRIGIRRHSPAAAYLQKNALDAQFEIVLYSNQTALWQALKKQDIDLALTEQWVAYAWMQKQPAKKYNFFAYPLAENSKVGIALRKNDPELRDKLNEALNVILRNGTYRAISQQYFPFSIY